MTALAAIIAACIAGVTTVVATESVSSRRRYEAQRAVNKKRKNVYDAAIRLLIQANAGGSPLDEDARVRSLLSIWASEDVLAQFGEYNLIINRILLANPNVLSGMPQIVPAPELSNLHSQVGKIAAMMREEVAEDEKKDSSTIARKISQMIFNDHGDSSVAPSDDSR